MAQKSGALKMLPEIISARQNGTKSNTRPKWHLKKIKRRVHWAKIGFVKKFGGHWSDICTYKYIQIGIYVIYPKAGFTL